MAVVLVAAVIVGLSVDPEAVGVTVVVFTALINHCVVSGRGIRRATTTIWKSPDLLDARSALMRAALS